MALVEGEVGVQGAFSHSANHYSVYPGNTPETHPPTEACMIHSKPHGDPGTRGKHQTKKRNPWCTSRGCRVQNSRPRDPWRPGVETAGFSHSAGTAHGAPPAPPDHSTGHGTSCSSTQQQELDTTVLNAQHHCRAENALQELGTWIGPCTCPSVNGGKDECIPLG